VPNSSPFVAAQYAWPNARHAVTGKALLLLISRPVYEAGAWPKLHNYSLA
jgi:hypothetical protein